MDVLLVDEGDVLGGAVVPVEYLYEVLLDLPGLLHDVLVGVGNGVLEELLPLAVGKLVIVQSLQLTAEVGDQVGLLVDWQIPIALLGEQMDELPLQRRLALVAVGAFFHRLVGGDHGIFGCGGDNIERSHFNTSPESISSEKSFSFIKSGLFSMGIASRKSREPSSQAVRMNRCA